MGKISPVSIKYIIRASIKLSGVVEKPDVIGAVFGQTEGLLGSDLELRELQKSGRIGRIEVNTEVSNGKAEGEILIPSSMGKSETAIIAAAMETIERVGPCNADIKVLKIEDVRISKREFIVKRAKELLKTLVEELPDSQALTTEIAENVRELEIREYGKDRLPAGPSIDDSEELIVVEGRADVMTLLRYGFRNTIAIGGVKTGSTITDLIRTKVVTVFVDGDRGGDLILKNLLGVGEIDFVARAPDGKEVEELTLKEINQALRARVTWEQVHIEKSSNGSTAYKSNTPERIERSERTERSERYERPRRTERREETETRSPVETSKKDSKILKDMAEELVGSHGAFILDESGNVLGKVPTKELKSTLEDMDGIHTIILDGPASRDLIELAEKRHVKRLVSKKLEGRSRSVSLLDADRL